MRIRSTKPEFWQSETIGQLDWDTRLVLKALESYVDDNGVGRDREVFFAASAFPHDVAKSPEICAKVSGSLQKLAEVGIIVRYAYDGERLIYVRHWKRWQYVDKPKAGRYPRPDGSLNYREPVDETIGPGQYWSNPSKGTAVREVSPELRETFANSSGSYPQIQSGEQGNRGTEEQKKDDDPPLEPPDDLDDPGQPNEVVGDAPKHIDNPAKPARRHPSSASKTVVRQELGAAGYPRTILERLAVQVENLARERHPDQLIREALREWDRRDNCDIPEYLPTVLGDLVKRSRATPGATGRPVHKVRGLAELAHEERANEHAELNTAAQRELTP